MRVSVSLDFSLILSWSSEEAGRYLETFKMYENKPVDMITEKTGNTPFEVFQDAITVIKSVNKTDALTLAKNFKVKSLKKNTLPFYISLDIPRNCYIEIRRFSTLSWFW